ncbi:MAG: ABC-type transport auxiliary lipoprotein family protein [Caulobacteraceae bacterium]
MTKLKTSNRGARLVAAAGVALALGGCVSLLPKAPPVQTFQVGRSPTPAAGVAPSGPGVGVVLTTVSLPRAAAGDSILTITGDQTAYLAGARWSAPAAVMVQEDAESAFAAHPGPVRLLHRGDFAGASALLTLDLADFEARYDNGAGVAPAVVVSIRATLSQPSGGALASQTFTVKQPAGDNRIAPIAAAFDMATTQALGLVVAWTNGQAPLIPPKPGAVTTTTSTSSTSSSTTMPKPQS